MTYVSPPPPHPLGQHRPLVEKALADRGLGWDGRAVQRPEPPPGPEDSEASDGDLEIRLQADVRDAKGPDGPFSMSAGLPGPRVSGSFG